jgi:ABC-type nickel/cobalt efflux system permease component RcnA
MEAKRSPKPTWWPLYVLMILLIGLIALVEATVAERGPRVVLESFVVIALFGMMWWWLRSNRVAMELQNAERREFVARPRPTAEDAAPGRSHHSGFVRPAPAQRTQDRPGADPSLMRS